MLLIFNLLDYFRGNQIFHFSQNICIYFRLSFADNICGSIFLGKTIPGRIGFPAAEYK